MCCLNWGATEIGHNTLKSHKMLFIWISLKILISNATTLFYTISNLLCLFCWHVVSILFAPQFIYFTACWATVTKGVALNKDLKTEKDLGVHIESCMWKSNRIISHFASLGWFEINWNFKPTRLKLHEKDQLSWRHNIKAVQLL